MKMLVKYSNVFYELIFFSIKIVGTVFVSSPFDLASVSIILSDIIAESSIILAKYFAVPQLHVAGFNIFSKRYDSLGFSNF